jgi:hypothetical protein
MNGPSDRPTNERAMNRRANTESAPARPASALSEHNLWPAEARTAFLKIL